MSTTTSPKFFELLFADRCGWRAFYTYVRGQRLLCIGIDAGIGSGAPQCFGWFLNLEWRFTVPHASWPFACRGSTLVDGKLQLRPWRLGLYKLSQRFWHAFDGRYHFFPLLFTGEFVRKE